MGSAKNQGKYYYPRERIGNGDAWRSLPETSVETTSPHSHFLHVCLLAPVCVRWRGRWLLTVLEEPESYLWDSAASANAVLPPVLLRVSSQGSLIPPSVCL